MSRLSVYLLGDFQVHLDGQNITRKFRTNKERALFAYLVIESERPHMREFLSDLFWPRQNESSSRANLRQALLGIRRALEEQKDDPIFVSPSEETIQINPQASIWVDAIAFSSRLQTTQDHHHLSLSQCDACIQRLSEAVDLYRQEFLAGLYLEESQAFHDWQIVNREHFLRLLLTALDSLAEFFQNAGNLELAQKYAWKYVHLDPLEEAAHRRLMELLTLNGHRSAALEQFHTCAHILETELRIAPSDETFELYKKIKLGDRIESSFSGLGAASPKIPPQFTTFIGRRNELEALSNYLSDPTCRLVNVAGPAGCGKSRLIIESAQQLKSNFKDGVYYFSTETSNSNEMLLSYISRMLGLTITLKEPLIGLIRFLHNKQTLLVFDHFDGVLDQANLLLEILTNAPEIKILLASRQRLNLQSAQLLELAGLEYPDSTTAQDLLTFPAVQLFIQRAKKARSSFIVTSETAPWIVSICQITSGLPLAIELAASHLRMLSCQNLFAELEKGLAILSTTTQDVPQNHRSFTAALLPSWEKLTDQERNVFARLSIFPDKFSLPAAEAVAEASTEILITLLEKSMLQETQDRLFFLLPLIQKFAFQQLSKDALLQQQTLQQHNLYYLSRLQEFASDNIISQSVKLNQFEQEYESFRLAVESSDRTNPQALPADIRALWERYRQKISTAESKTYPQKSSGESEYNSKAFVDQLHQSLSSAARKALPAAVLLLKLTPVPDIQEDVNNKLTTLLNDQLRHLLRAHDSVAQTEMNTFGIILENLSHSSDAYTVARKIMQSLEQPVEIDGKMIQVKGQIGIGIYPIDGDEAGQLMDKAETSILGT